MLLRFNNDTLEFLEDWELLISSVDFSVSLSFAKEEPYFFETLQFALDVAWIFFDKLGKATYVGSEIRIFSIDHNDLAPHP